MLDLSPLDPKSNLPKSDSTRNSPEPKSPNGSKSFLAELKSAEKQNSAQIIAKGKGELQQLENIAKSFLNPSTRTSIQEVSNQLDRVISFTEQAENVLADYSHLDFQVFASLQRDLSAYTIQNNRNQLSEPKLKEAVEKISETAQHLYSEL